MIQTFEKDHQIHAQDEFETDFRKFDIMKVSFDIPNSLRLTKMKEEKSKDSHDKLGTSVPQKEAI